MFSSNVEIVNLKFDGVRTVRLREGKVRTETHSLGGGEWSIELYIDDQFYKEWIGLNGTRPDEEKSDLWSEFDQWWEHHKNDILYKQSIFVAPDGYKMSARQWKRQIEKYGIPEGCYINIK